MSDDAGLLAHIREQPDDDLPRLVYADWCEEHGKADRAEFIRLQVELARLAEYDRPPVLLGERALLKKHGKEWVGPLKAAGKVEWRRGFIEVVRWSAANLLAHGDLLASAPVQEVVLTGSARWMTRVAACRFLEGVRCLTLPGTGIKAAHLSTLADSPHLGNLTGLKLSHLGISADRLRGVAPLLPRLEQFEAHSSYLIAGDMQTLVDAQPARLRRLSLRHNGLGPEGVAILATSPHLVNLTHLDLAYCELNSLAGRHLAASPHLRKLERLDLHFNRLNRLGAQALAASPILATVRELEIGFNEITDTGVKALARSPHLTNIRHLNISHSYMRTTGLPELVRSPLLGRLHWLALHYNTITDEQVAALAASPGVANLRHLILRNNDFGKAGVRALASSPHLSGLRWLHLGRNKFGMTGSKALASSPNLAGLWGLSCKTEDCGKRGLEVLRKRFGKALELEL